MKTYVKRHDAMGWRFYRALIPKGAGQRMSRRKFRTASEAERYAVAAGARYQRLVMLARIP